MLLPGTIIADRYRLEHLLGQGGMGSVWAATHLVTKKAVALKFLHGKYASEPAAIKRFLREARAASAVRHPNVVEIHDVLQFDEDAPVMIMDLLHGESLGARLARERRLSLADLARILVPVLSALGTAHALGIVHRDLKPDNIFLEIAGDGALVPKVLDFGIAKLNATEGAAAQTAELTNTGSIMGTPYYMAPEQIFGEKDVDQRADVWAIGIILYEALAGTRPVDGENLGRLLKMLTSGEIPSIDQHAPDIPADVRALVTRMLTVERERRPFDLSEAFRVLRGYTDVGALSFPGLQAPSTKPKGTDPAFVSAPTEQVSSTLVMSAAASGPEQDPGLARTELAAPESMAALARTDTEGSVVTPRKSTRWLPISLVGAGLVAAGVVVALRSQVATDGSAGSVTALASAAPSAAPLEVVATASPLPSASTSAAPSASTTSSTTRPQATRRPPPVATTVTAPVVTATAAPTPEKLPGGVAEKPPF